MKAVILAVGYGTRISEETHLIPKPMLPIGGKPILWHIIKIQNPHGLARNPHQGNWTNHQGLFMLFV